MAFVYDAQTHKITCPRNNTGALEISVEGMELQQEDVLEFYVRDPARAKRLYELVLHPADGPCIVSLNSDDTAKLPPGKYRWNMRIVTAPQFDEIGRLTTAEDSANSITVYNIPPVFEVLEV